MALPTTAVQGGIAAPGIAPARGGGGAPLASDRVDPASPTSFASISAQSRSPTDAQGGQPFYSDVSQQGNGSRSWLTPLIFRAALGFAAVAPLQGDWRAGGPTFLTDLQHGVGVYEYNMKIQAGSAALPGGVINQFS